MPRASRAGVAASGLVGGSWSPWYLERAKPFADGTTGPRRRLCRGAGLRDRRWCRWSQLGRVRREIRPWAGRLDGEGPVSRKLGIRCCDRARSSVRDWWAATLESRIRPRDGHLGRKAGRPGRSAGSFCGRFGRAHLRVQCPLGGHRLRGSSLRSRL